MEVWAKLFESNGRQVLVSKEFDDDDNPKVSFAVRIDGSELSLGPVFSGDDAESARDKFFESVDQETVDAFTKPLIGCETVFEAAKALRDD